MCLHACLKIKMSTFLTFFKHRPNQSHQFYIFTPLTDIRDDEGRSPLDLALDSYISHFDVALYLFSHGCDDDRDKAKLLCEASQQNRLDIVKELVEDHRLDPKG